MKKGIRFFSVFMFFIGLCVLILPPASLADGENVRLICLNIGKADCMLLLWEEKAFLIDTGYEQNFPALLSMLDQYRVSHLNGVFLTHCHQDHQGGLQLLAESNIPVDAWYAAEIYYDEKPEKHAAALAAGIRGESVIWLQSEDVIPAGNNAFFKVLGPVTQNTENENNNSLVLRFSSPHGSILLAGDMKEEEEKELQNRGLLDASTVLKVGHHGDSGATKKGFLSVVKPKAALISTNTQEESDTPAESTLTRLYQAGCQVYVTQDAHDALEATLENGQVTVRDISWENVPERQQGLRLSIHMADDLLTIENTSSDSIALKKCRLYSSRGNDLLELPDMTLEPGQTFRIGSRATNADYQLKWDKKRIWHQSKLDIAVLYDGWGRGIAWTNNGMPD